VGGLTSRSLQGTVPLDTKWRDLLKLPEQSGNERRFSWFLAGLRINRVSGSGFGIRIHIWIQEGKKGPQK
jgi:hypothetical protein